MPPDRADGPAERRLAEYMELLRGDPPRTDRSLASRVARRARWQSAFREPVRVASTVLGAVWHSFTALAAGGRGKRRDS